MGVRKEDLSTKPTQVRKRARRLEAREVEEAENRIEVLGYKPVEEWDWQELAHGKPRSKDGSFKGRPPKWITPVIANEATRRLMTEVTTEMARFARPAVIVMARLLKDPDPRIRLEAARFFIEHIKGKAKVHVDVDAGDNIIQFLSGATLVLGDGSPAHPVIDGQFYDEPEDDSDLDHLDDTEKVPAIPTNRQPRDDDEPPRRVRDGLREGRIV